jgi:hypothetical protein
MMHFFDFVKAIFKRLLFLDCRVSVHVFNIETRMETAERKFDIMSGISLEAKQGKKFTNVCACHMYKKWVI